MASACPALWLLCALHDGCCVCAVQGRFSADEDIRLAQLVAERGNKWTEIGAALGRMPNACRDRWREIRCVR